MHTLNSFSGSAIQRQMFCIVKSYAVLLSISLTARTCKHSDKMLSKMYHALLVKTKSVYGSIFQLHVEVARTICYPCIFTHCTCTLSNFIYFILQLALYIISTIIIIQYYMYVHYTHTHYNYVRKLVSACWLASLENAANGATYVEAALHQG